MRAWSNVRCNASQYATGSASDPRRTAVSTKVIRALFSFIKVTLTSTVCRHSSTRHTSRYLMMMVMMMMMMMMMMIRPTFLLR